MKTIEITGAIGAGKSSLVRPLSKELAERGVDARPLGDIIALSRRRAAVWAALFALRRPRLLVAAVLAALASPLPWWHRRTIVGLTLGVGGRLMAAARHVGPDAWVIVDEGLAHRTVNLFGWRPRPWARGVQLYLGQVPAGGLLVLVDASPAAADGRAARRGLPKRLAGRSDPETRAFMNRARELTELAVATLQQRGTGVVRVANPGSVEGAASAAADAIVTLSRPGLGGSDASPARRVDPFTFRYPLIPRPDRLARRSLARRTRSVDAGRIGLVLAAYDLAAIGDARSVPSPGGRGAAMRASTHSGEVLVKRYKATVGSQTVALEHAVLAELEQCRLPAPRLRRTAGGATSVTLDGDIFAVYDYLSGYRHPHEYFMSGSDRARLEHAAGAVLGAFHDALEDFQPPPSEQLGFASRSGPRVRGLAWYTARLADVPAPRRVRAWIESALVRLNESLDREQLGCTVVHGDFGPYNLLVQSGTPPVVVDWELARLDWRLVDLATCLPRFAGRFARFDTAAARRVIAGYRDQTGISTAHLRRVPDVLALLRLQRAVVCWSRLGDDAARWDAEARHRVLQAEALLRGADPVCAVVSG